MDTIRELGHWSCGVFLRAGPLKCSHTAHMVLVKLQPNGNLQGGVKNLHDMYLVISTLELEKLPKNVKGFNWSGHFIGFTFLV